MKYSKIGLALGGGGARGFAHVGVLKYLEENGIHPDIVSGTSAGSIVAAAYAMGHTAEEIYDFFSQVDPRKLELITKRNDGGLVSSSFLQKALKEFFGDADLEDSRIPVKVVATDLDLGRTRVFESGSAALTVLASCTLPIVFAPVKIDDHYFVDGGLYKNFPVTTIRDYCDILIGVNIGSKIADQYDMNIKNIGLRCWNLISKENVIYDNYACDILIDSPKFSKFSIYDHKQAPKLYKLGYKLAKESEKLNKLIELKKKQAKQ
ncbi:MAG: patatin-like phospholipase family protein [Porphyromonas sp.]|nr:patatin-like phospholipase family protein [Porphyromonas sp.]